MKAAQVGSRVALKNILFLTDFSEPSERALPYALAMAREFGARLHALHVMIPQPYSYATPELMEVAIKTQEECAESSMQQVDAQMAGLVHQTHIVRGTGLWLPLVEVINDCSADMLVLGTHGRTGPQKLLLGSVAEEIFRRSAVPVLTIGPDVRSSTHTAARFRRVLLATDFSEESKAAVPYAISLAQENQAELVLLHVIPGRKGHEERVPPEISVANAMHELYELVPPEAELWCRPEPTVRYGEPAPTILATAEELGADLIVLGVRDSAGRLGAATHLERAVAHKVVAHAKCPVLTVRA
ncbi:MAG TPA: universal stress protein [Candidatus Acidoferrales bacterium]|nr:universal stress protein [Candidatus Acidoferrales bacterium]